jgi:methylmalonyl-CoA mutase N-terminal domain/subunit
VTVALRTQQIILHESGAANSVDPLAGSYYVEWLTNRLEADALAYIARIEQMGGMVAAIEKGYPQREVALSAYEFERKLQSGERTVVGVNAHRQAGSEPIPTLRIDPALAAKKLSELAALKAERSAVSVSEALARVRRAARDGANLVEPVIFAARAYATEQEICDVLREVFGTYADPAEF